jgi:hypothetical protein
MRPTGARGKGGGMSEGEVSRSWVGKQITVRYFHGNGTSDIQGTLRAVDDRGLLLEARDGKLWHYPWTAVLRYGGIWQPTEE